MIANPVILDDIHNITRDFDELDFFRNKTILITGANGFLPAYLVETFLHLSHTNDFNINVIALVRNKERAQKRFAHWMSSRHLKIVVQDVSAPFTSDDDIHIIFHAASQASPKYYGTDPVGTLLPNILGTYNLLELARRKNVASFVFFSSGEVYGQVDDDLVPIKETTFGYVDPATVRSCYAESKRMGENMCVSWANQYNVKTKIVRPFHTYGPGMSLDDGRVFADFSRDIIHGADIVMKSDGSARRAFCYLADATRAFLLIAVAGQTGQAYNVGNPDEEHSIAELAEIMVTLRPSLNLKVIRSERDAATSTYLKSPLIRNSPDITRARALGWSPATSVREGFDRTIKSFLISQP